MAAKIITKKYDENSLDSVLVQLGDFGKYQIFVVFLLSVPLILVSAMHLNFVFTAMNIQHRCEIPGCDPKTNPEFKPHWLKNAVPFDERNEPKSCTKYASVKNHHNCSCAEFIANREEKCTSYVYASPEITTLHDFNLQCDENLWLLTMIGSASNIGEFIGTPIMGYVADRSGRKKVLVWGTIACILAGIARAFTTSYLFFVTCEFIGAFFGGPVFCIGFVMGIELVGPKKRVLSGSIISTYYALGEIWIAILASFIMSWRWLLLALYMPALICIAYHWILPESVRWLLTQGKNEEAFGVLRNVASVNGKEISEEALKELSVAEEGRKHEGALGISKLQAAREDSTKPSKGDSTKPLKGDSTKPLNKYSAEPLKEVSIRDLKEDPVEPLKEDQGKSLKEVSSEPLKEVSSEPLKEVSSEPLKEVSSEPLKDISSQPLKEVSEEPLKEDQGISLREVSSEPSEEVSSEPLKEVSSEPLKDISSQPLKEVSTEPLKEVSEEPLKEVSEEPLKEDQGISLREVSSEPSEEVSSEPLKEVSSEPLKEVSSEPLKVISSEPLKEVSSQPLKEVSKEPLKEVSDKPLKKVYTEPLKEVSEEPLKEVSKEPLKEVSKGHLKRVPKEPLKEVSKEPLKEVSSKPLKNISSEPLKEVSSESLKEVSKKPLKEVSETPLKEVSEKPLEEVSKEPLKGVPKEPLKEVSKEPLEEVSEEPLKEFSDEPIKEVSKEPLKGVTKEPLKEVSKEPLEEVSEEPLKEVSEEPLKEVSEEPLKEVSEAPLKEMSKDPSKGVPKEPLKKVSKKPLMEVSEKPLKEVLAEPARVDFEKPLKEVSEKSLKGVRKESSMEMGVEEEAKSGLNDYPIMEVFKSRCLLFRLFLCFVCWITSTFLFYGLTLNSVTLSGNHKVDFILDAVVEFPGYLAVYFLIDRIGRRATQCAAFWLTSIACVAFISIDPGSQWLRFISYLLGKVGATLAVSVCYFFTSELFPTSLRQSMMGWCSTVGRIGSMAAPQMPLLAKIWGPWPLVLYTVLGFIAGYLTLLFPETSKIELPDTIKEAENLGKTPKESKAAKLWKPLSIFIHVIMKYIPRPLTIFFPKACKLDLPSSKEETGKFRRMSRKASDVTRYNTFNVER